MSDWFDLLKNRMGDNGVIEVTAEEMRLIVESTPEPYDPKPSPPIKVRCRRGGMFHKEAWEEYDHSAPEYLRQLEEWRLRGVDRQRPRDLTFHGPHKSYRVVLKSGDAGE